MKQVIREIICALRGHAWLTHKNHLRDALYFTARRCERCKKQEGCW